MTDLLERPGSLTGDVPAPEASTTPEPPETVLPVADGPIGARRVLGGWSVDDRRNLVGALVSGVSVALLLFGRLAPLEGSLGFIVTAYLAFLAIYATLTSLSDDRPAVVDKVMTVVLTSAAALAGIALASVIIYTFVRGREALLHTNFYLQDMAATGPADPLSQGGIAHALVGTLIMMSLALLFTVPLGIACAVYLNESSGRFAHLARTVVNAMTALPSVLAGLFIFATWILGLGFPRSGLAAALAISIMMLPIIIRSADVVLRLVPGGLREAAAALGAPTWRTVWHVVLPTARSGLATSVILGVARGVGETSPVLLTAGYGSVMNVNPMQDPMVSLPLATFEFVRASQATMVSRGFATAAVLMVVVLVLFVIARTIGGRPAGTVSRRQAKRLAKRSAADLARFNARHDRGGTDGIDSDGIDADADAPDGRAAVPTDLQASSPNPRRGSRADVHLDPIEPGSVLP